MHVFMGRIWPCPNEDAHSHIFGCEAFLLLLIMQVIKPGSCQQSYMTLTGAAAEATADSVMISA